MSCLSWIELLAACAAGGLVGLVAGALVTAYVVKTL